MKRLLILFAMTIVLMGLYGFWVKLKTQNDTLLLWSLTPLERECARQIVGSNDLVFVQSHSDNQSIAVGYMIGSKYYVSIFGVDSTGSCEVSFQEEVFECYDQILSSLCDQREYKITPKSVQVVELTGDETPEIYVWYLIRGFGRGGERHVFYQKQSDGSNQVLLHLRLCPKLSTVTILSEPQRILAVNDLVCDMFHDQKESLEYSLAGGTVQVIGGERDSEFSPK
jgi:hypothetical protein